MALVSGVWIYLNLSPALGEELLSCSWWDIFHIVVVASLLWFELEITENGDMILNVIHAYTAGGLLCLVVGYMLPQIYRFFQCIKVVLFSIAALKQIDVLTIELSQFELDKVVTTSS